MSKFPISAKAILKKFRAARAESLLPILPINGGMALAGVPQMTLFNVTGASSPALNVAFTEVTDILDPLNTGGWTTINEYIAAAPFYVELSRYNNAALGIDLYNGEPADAALRLQVLVDGGIAWDAYAVADGVSGTTISVYLPTANSAVGFLYPVFCNESFEIRAARKGSFSSASSKIHVSQINIRRLR